ncbi:hypothetical protein COHA_008879 [Chlorella ohadii]|uniref:Uncharacterized protein n=1 Tax=Chlorella ohadii TaxID=2649997 RepID=A0AAD5DFW1_9CHLO|nr:hypothetical protein COHA_008879 [Chlorella ohadii]
MVPQLAEKIAAARQCIYRNHLFMSAMLATMFEDSGWAPPHLAPANAAADEYEDRAWAAVAPQDHDKGFQAQGSEFSYFMLLASAYLLNGVQRAEQWTIHLCGMQHVGKGVLLLDLDGPQWRMVWCNEAFCSAAGIVKLLVGAVGSAAGAMQQHVQQHCSWSGAGVPQRPLESQAAEVLRSVRLRL